MPSPEQARRALQVITAQAVSEASTLLRAGSADAVNARLLEATPSVIAYYSDGSAALAADHYDDLREAAGATGDYLAEPIVRLRQEKIEHGVLWAASPLFDPDPDRGLAQERLAQVVQLETARPFRDTITTNTRRDPSAVGWQRISSTGCKFCQMLAARGAVYKESTARFASHPHCHCTASPVFDGQGGQEASVLQYVASQRTRTPAQRQALRDHLAAMPD